MAESSNSLDTPAWRLFLQCCDIIAASLPEATRSAALVARREGVTGPESVRIFVHVFEAAIDASRTKETWDSLSNVLNAAAAEIVFRRPSSPSNIQITTDSPAHPAHPRVVFDSFARCFACAVAQSKAIPPEAPILTKEFARCLRAWESETIEYDIIAPVTGVHLSEAEPLEIGNGIEMVAVHDAVSERMLYDLNAFHGTFLPSTVLLAKRVIGKSADLDEFVGTCVADITQCVTAIRLATNRVIGSNAIHVVPSESYFQTFNGMVSFANAGSEIILYGKPDLAASPITVDEIAETRKALELLSGKSGEQLAIAIERFNFAFGRVTTEDQVIDLAIALESTICRGGGNDQLSYRFRLFGAAILASIPGTEDAFEVLDGLYKARSKVVHAGKRLGELIVDTKGKKLFVGRSIPNFVTECRNLTRLIILQFLRQAADGRSPEEYIQALERAIVSVAKKSIPEAH
jgi:hypothetical protein